MVSFFRYPGGKSKIKDQISSHLNAYAHKHELEYREPFFGGGSVGLTFINDNPHWHKIWINDKDVGVASLWTSVIKYPNELKTMVKHFKPTIEAFYQFKKDLSNIDINFNIVEIGFKKLAIHQISYSGLGTKSGGPLGGKDQLSKYKIDCRWSPSYICKKIDKLNRQFKMFTLRDECCTCLDFSDVVKNPSDAILYLDPPYYDKGNELYQCGFTDSDHLQLSQVLRKINNPWILSYDDCPEIRKLYDWAIIDVVNVNYSITSLKVDEKRISRVKPELLIYPKSHVEALNGCGKFIFA